MRQEYGADPTNFVNVATSGTDASLTVPYTTTGDAINGPAAMQSPTGSLWWLTVEGATVAWNEGATAVFSTNAKITVGSSIFSHPIQLTPGAVLHFITAGGSGSVSITRALRKS